ncbi:MAG: dihydroorotase [Deltaproteobacteria bacterium]|nr:dihydroorotase [Deltaproteobacteria bacterium]
MRTLIKGARVIDPGCPNGPMDDRLDVLIQDDRIADIKPEGILEVSSGNDIRIYDAKDRILTPGLIDMHVHFREPGQEYKETIATGCRAAAAGGFTAVCTMPNTNPVNDNGQITRFILSRAAEACGVRVYPVGAISKSLDGKSLSEFGELKDAGAIAVTDDGKPVTSSLLMRRAMEYAGGLGLTIISHCEDMGLAHGGAMNEGTIATRLGLPGIPNAAETIMVLRDIALCELTGARLHIAHVSTLESVRAIREAKKNGIPVTAETAPHYFTLTDDAVREYSTHAKMNPPLRTQKDVDAICEGLRDGTLDVIATDHAPHSPVEKDVEFDRAANGIIGLETSLALGLRLVESGVLSLNGLIDKMSTQPARILGLSSGLKIGAAADITLIDPDRIWTVDAGRFQSVSRNTPFNGWTLKGKAVFTMVNGTVVFENRLNT